MIKMVEFFKDDDKQLFSGVFTTVFTHVYKNVGRQFEQQ